MNETVNGLGKFDCPFCTGYFSISVKGGEPNGVIHTLPLCNKFQDLSPDRFLEAARLEKENNAQAGNN